MTSNLHEDENKEAIKPSAETTDEAATSEEKKTAPEAEVDYKTKFSESSKEAQRLLEEKKKLEAEKVQYEDVMNVLYENPDLLKEVQDAYTRSNNPTTETGRDIGIVTDKVLEKKVREVVSPITAELESERRQRVEETVTDFAQKHPDAAEGSDTWKSILEWLPAMRAKGLPLKQGLEKAYDIVNVDKAKQSGKVEALRYMFEKQTASVSGGVSSTAKDRTQETELTSEERKVARSLGIKEENYAKHKK